jgi:hypothetical protein
MAADDNLSAAQFTTLYRGEGTHDRPSLYTEMGKPELAGQFYAKDRKMAEHYAADVQGKVYQLTVRPGEYKEGTKTAVVPDPAVRARRTVVPPYAPDEDKT